MSYKIKSDSHNFTIVKCTVDSNGKEKEDVVGYYPTIKALYLGAANKMIKVIGLDEAVVLYNELDAMCQSAIKVIEDREKAKKAEAKASKESSKK